MKSTMWTVCGHAFATSFAAAMLSAGAASAQVSGPGGNDQATHVEATNGAPASAPDVAPVNPPDRTPLMMLLDRTPVGAALDNARINIYGWFEGSYEYNFNRPLNKVANRYENNGRTYDFFEHDNGQLNEADLNIERTVQVTGDHWDVGGHVEAMFGTDAFFTRSNGLLDHEADSHGLYQLDALQAYVDVSVPVGNGLRIRAGKFEFVKPVNPNARLFYTDTFAYHGAFPFTLTGVTATYSFTPDLTVEAGVSRGWNSSIRDNNGSIDGIARLTWKVTPDSRFTAALITGPELPHDSSHWTTAVDIGYSQKVGDNLGLFFDGVFDTQAAAPNGIPPGTLIPTRAVATESRGLFYGLSADALYQINELLTVGVRIEWLRDEEGYLTGTVSNNLYDATIGLNVTPLHSTPIGKNFVLRPEFRYDYSSIPLFYPSPGKHGQFTFAIDAIINF